MENMSDAVFTAQDFYEEKPAQEVADAEVSEQTEDVAPEAETAEIPSGEEPEKTDGEEKEPTEEQKKQSADADRIAAEARRAMERVKHRADEAEKKFQDTLRERDRLLSAIKTFGYGTNGESPEEIAAALIAAQRNMTPAEVKKEFEEEQKRIDNDPRVVAALEFEKRQLASLAMQQDLAAIKAAYPEEHAAKLEDIKGIDKFIEYKQRGYDTQDAYFLANRDALTKKPKPKPNDKEHVVATGGNGAGAAGAEIPTGDLETWREAFPNDTAAQLRERYNRYLKRTGG